VLLYLILALALSLLVTLFAVQNNAATEVTFLFWKLEGSLALILMVTFAAGILIGLLVSVPAWIRARLKAASLERSQRRSREAPPKPEGEPIQAPGAERAAEDRKRPPTS
jgi:uncharacterized integral membrane protein